MTLQITQICDKCKAERSLSLSPDGRLNVKVGGWRQINGKDICAEDLRKLTDG